ncbi:MAG: hypothetical protein J6K22_11325 [Spirochaetaceae bacterium]|nr:hypothetical protein [Treponema sp.]MBP3451041.1 hypothetical protein [Spirochaetaceae bacterium]
MNICKKFIFIFLIFFTLGVFAQQNLSVPLNDNVYFLLENASLRGILPTLPAAKPYTLSFVLDNLNTVLASDILSEIEKEVFIKTYDRLAQNTPQKWYRTGYYTNKFDENVKLPITAGFTWTSEASINCNNPDFSHEHWGDVYIKGDITKYFSYNFNIGGSLMDLSTKSYAPNTYQKTWDGFQFVLSDFYEYVSISDLPAGGLRMLPELAFSVFDSKVQVKFSRTRHDWGYGSGNLMLSGTARPFVSLETQLNPVSWFSTNFITGTLEYDSNGNLKDCASTFQNMYSALWGELKFKYFYFGATGSVVFPKRIELGYMNPFMLAFLYQNQIGDFDNMQLGLFTGITIPKITHIYASIFMDELNVQVSNFLNKDRNMYAVQIGAKSPLPFWTSIFTFQYTKIEPYMYSHPLTDVPWYDKPMDTTYINHGQPLGYFLNPNSDEFKIQLESNPLWYLLATLKYTLVRHGTTTGSGKVDGSSFYDPLNYSGNIQDAQEGDLYWKDFLHDGVYEWINSISLGGELNCRKWDIPITVGLTYTFSYTHHTLGTKDSIKNINNAEYQNKAGNYLTLSIKVY